MSGEPGNIVQSHIWNGVYESWEEVSAVLQDGGDAFQSDRWLERITQQLLDYRAAHATHGAALPPRPCSLPWVAALTQPRSILDFGGSSGWVWEYLKNSLPRNCIVSYVILEIASVAVYMRGRALHGEPVTYRSLDEPVEPCDLLYANSVLQYIASNAPLVATIEQTTPQYVFLEDVVAKNSNDWFTTQAYFDAPIPYRFLGLQRLIDDLSRIGYHELARCPYGSPVFGTVKPFEMLNFPEHQRLQYSLSLLFSRSGSS
jgi:putative methyltransferase (TIGR04325 family)